MIDHIDLEEEADLFLSKDRLSEAQALALYSDPHFEFDWPNPGNEFRYRLRSKGWVGHIPVGNTMLVVRPKVPVSSIFGMLEVAYKLKSFNILEGETAVERLEEIYERVASILAKRVNDRFRKGLYRAYLEKREDLQFVRGRVDIRGNIRNALVTAPRLYCQYEELTADVEENVILLWALYVASRSRLSRDDVKRQVRQAYRNLVGAVSLELKSPRDCMRRLYNRLNNDYLPMHGLSRFLIEHAGPGARIGGHEFLPFSVEMPLLFETFVAEWLPDHLPKSLMIDVQRRVRLNANADLSYRFDIVLRDRLSGKALAVIDTKYKSTAQPLESDIQQVVAYAVELGVSRAHLIYPFVLSHPIEIRTGDIRVSTTGVDLSRPLSETGNAVARAVAPESIS